MPRMFLLCGRDAAERILTWDYGDPEFADKMLGEFGLLVAPREGEYVAPERFRHAIRSLDPGNYDDCSSTRLRETIRHTDDWRVLVPDAIADHRGEDLPVSYSPALASRNARRRWLRLG